jgi:carbon-monoxide dehydrogenase small subunit
MLSSAQAFLDETPKPTARQIRESIDGNICRCTGYNSIIRAITAVVKGEYKEEK